MLFISLGIYTLFLLGVWGFFVVAKLHAYKFKNFSTNIVPFTTILLVFLVFLSIAGYVVIFTSPFFPTARVSVTDSRPVSEEVIEKSQFEDLDFNEINY